MYLKEIHQTNTYSVLGVVYANPVVSVKVHRRKSNNYKVTGNQSFSLIFDPFQSLVYDVLTLIKLSGSIIYVRH